MERSSGCQAHYVASMEYSNKELIRQEQLPTSLGRLAGAFGAEENPG
jgi:hypothetical protein